MEGRGGKIRPFPGTIFVNPRWPHFFPGEATPWSFLLGRWSLRKIRFCGSETRLVWLVQGKPGRGTLEPGEHDTLVA